MRTYDEVRELHPEALKAIKMLGFKEVEYEYELTNDSRIDFVSEDFMFEIANHLDSYEEIVDKIAQCVRYKIRSQRKLVLMVVKQPLLPLIETLCVVYNIGLFIFEAREEYYSREDWLKVMCPENCTTKIVSISETIWPPS
jgi:hypothetical protein